MLCIVICYIVSYVNQKLKHIKLYNPLDFVQISEIANKNCNSVKGKVQSLFLFKLWSFSKTRKKGQEQPNLPLIDLTVLAIIIMQTN